MGSQQENEEGKKENEEGKKWNGMNTILCYKRK